VEEYRSLSEVVILVILWREEKEK